MDESHCRWLKDAAMAFINPVPWMEDPMITEDSKLYQYLWYLMTYTCLNVIFLVLCIPVVTAAPALAALYGVSIQEADERYGYVFRSYFHMFKKYFLKSLLLGLIYAAAAAVFLYNMVFWYRKNSGILTGMISVLMAVLLAVCLTSMEYSLVIITEYDVTLREALYDGIHLSVDHPVFLVLFTAIDAGFAFGLRYDGFKIFAVIIGVALVVLIKSVCMLHVLKKHEINMDGDGRAED